jgi:hypothetical protein
MSSLVVVNEGILYPKRIFILLLQGLSMNSPLLRDIVQLLFLLGGHAIKVLNLLL